jgi:hypothetical protein
MTTKGKKADAHIDGTQSLQQNLFNRQGAKDAKNNERKQNPKTFKA